MAWHKFHPMVNSVRYMRVRQSQRFFGSDEEMKQTGCDAGYFCCPRVTRYRHWLTWRRLAIDWMSLEARDFSCLSDVQLLTVLSFHLRRRILSTHRSLPPRVLIPLRVLYTDFIDRLLQGGVESILPHSVTSKRFNIVSIKLLLDFSLLPNIS